MPPGVGDRPWPHHSGRGYSSVGRQAGLRHWDWRLAGCLLAPSAPGCAVAEYRVSAFENSDPLHQDRRIGLGGEGLQILRVLGEHDAPASLSECDDNGVDGRATASSGPQLRGAASDGLINRFHIAHPEKPLLKEVPAGIAPECLREDDCRHDRGPQADASKPAEPLSRGDGPLGQPGESSSVENRGVYALRGFLLWWMSGPVSLSTQAFASAT